MHFSKVKPLNEDLAMPLGLHGRVLFIIMGPKYCSRILHQEPVVSAIRQNRMIFTFFPQLQCETPRKATG